MDPDSSGSLHQRLASGLEEIQVHKDRLTGIELLRLKRHSVYVGGRKHYRVQIQPSNRS